MNYAKLAFPILQSRIGFLVDRPQEFTHDDYPCCMDAPSYIPAGSCRGNTYGIPQQRVSLRER